MNWFDEQIRQRKIEDDQILSESLWEAADAVLGKRSGSSRDERALTGDALERILRFYHLKKTEIPSSITSLEEQLEYALHPQGMMYRKIRLEGDWYKDATGAFLAFRQEDNAPLAIIPAVPFGYRCYDLAGGDSWFVRKKNLGRIKEEAYCFYHPFPQTKLSVSSLLRYILSCVRVIDFGSAERQEDAKNHPESIWYSNKKYYSPPEQTGALPQGPWSDIYALGVCMFKMAANGFPQNWQPGSP